MKQAFSSVSPKGQITLPVEFRRMLGLRPKDQVSISIEVEEGKLTVRPARYTLESVVGSVPPPTRTEDIEGIIQEAKEERAQRVMDKLHQST